MMKQDKPIQLRMEADTYYIWVGGSLKTAEQHKNHKNICNFAVEKRACV